MEDAVAIGGLGIRDRVAGQLRHAGLRPTRQRVELSRILFAKGNRLFTGAEGQEFPLIRMGVYDIGNPRSPQALGETLLRCLVAGMDYDVAQTDAFMPCEDETGDGISIFDVTPAGGASGPVTGSSNQRVPSIVVAAAAGALAPAVAGTAIRSCHRAGACGPKATFPEVSEAEANRGVA